MDRRQVLHSLNAIGICAALPTSAYSAEDFSVTTQGGMPPVTDDRAASDAAESEWTFPKIGIVSVGAVGRSCLLERADFAQSLPYLNRAVAIESTSAALSLMQGDRKVLVSDSSTLPNYDAGLFAQSAYSEITASVAGLDMALLVAEMGSDAGMSISPMVAQVLRRKSIVTLGFAVMPSDCVGQLRQQLAQAGLCELRQHVDALMPMFESSNASDSKPGARLLASQEDASRTFFRLCRAVMTPVCSEGWAATDFEDLTNIILGQDGDCAFGYGSASGVVAAAAAALQAIDHPLLGRSRLGRASAAFVAIAASPRVLRLRDGKMALNTVRKHLSANAHLTYSLNTDATLEKEITVSVLANGIRDT